MIGVGCSETKYIISYTWISGGKPRKMAVFAERSDAINYIKQHIDDSINLVWAIQKKENISSDESEAKQ